jgi:dihydrofolate reductase
MKLTIITLVTVDGVYQGPGSKGEDPRGGFERGGWMEPWDKGCQDWINDVYTRSDGFLFGRRTYEIFGSFWPNHTNPNSSAAPVAKALNSKPKYVLSRSLDSGNWPTTTILRDLDGLTRLKEQLDGEIQVHGSGELARGLLQNGLVDEWSLMVFPVILGAGMRLFPESGVDLGLGLVENLRTPNGVTIQTYRPEGRAKLNPD